jgi:hypothetical protein
VGRSPENGQRCGSSVLESTLNSSIEEAPCARLCHGAGGELEQIQFLLGHVSVQTTEKYLGCKQRLREAVNDKIGIEPVFS